MSEPIHVISLGAGVQSSTMALMAAHGEITPMPKCAIFADTQDEPEEVYTWLHRLEDDLRFPVHVVKRGPKLSDVVTHRTSLNESGTRFIAIPSFGSEGGMNRRQCTREFKVEPINKKLREIRNGSEVVLWIGISLDEAHRMKHNQLKYIRNIWPLIERRMTRWDCELWLVKHGYPVPPKSSCVYCPYHSNSAWASLKRKKGDWDKAVAVDKELNKQGQFCHRSLKPLDEVDFSTDEERGQQTFDGFGNECEGMCGV